MDEALAALQHSQTVRKLSSLKRVDFRWLDEQTIEELRQLFSHLYSSKGLSTTEIAKALGKSQLFAWSMCRRLGVVTRTAEEGGRLYAPKRTKNIRRPFDGTNLDRAYLQGFARGDLNVARVSSMAILVSTTTTHPDFVALFLSLFRPYGPVYLYPICDKKNGYKWKVAARLDNSFAFILPTENTLEPFSFSSPEFTAWLAGIVDTDGSIGMIHSGAYLRINIVISNQDIHLLNGIRDVLMRKGHHPTGPYCLYPKGYETPTRHVRYNEDMHYLALQRASEVRRLIELLPLRHGEKMRRKDLVLRAPVPAIWSSVGRDVEVLRRGIKNDVAGFVKKAEATYRRTSHKRRRESAT